MSFLHECPQDVLELVISWLPDAASLRGIQLVSSAFRDALLNIEPTHENNDLIVAHRMEMFRVSCLRGEEALQQLAGFMHQCRYASEKLEREAENIIAPNRERIEHMKTTLEAELESMVPAIDEAQKHLDCLHKHDLAEVRCYMRPPQPVLVVSEALLTLLNGKQPKPANLWNEFRMRVSDPYRLLQDLRGFDVEAVEPKVLKKVQTMVDDPQYDISRMKMVSHAAHAFGVWVRVTCHRAKTTVALRPMMSEYRELMQEPDAIRWKAGALRRRHNDLRDLPAQQLMKQQRRVRAALQQEGMSFCGLLQLEWQTLPTTLTAFNDHFNKESRKLLSCEEAGVRNATEKEWCRYVERVALMAEEVRSRAVLVAQLNSERPKIRAPTRKDLLNLRPSVHGTTWTPPTALAVRRSKQEAIPPHIQKLMDRHASSATKIRASGQV